MASPSGLCLSQKRIIDLTRCAVFQKIKDNKGSTKLTSTVKGREVLTKCSETLSDDLFHGLDHHQYVNIPYYVNNCYVIYVR